MIEGFIGRPGAGKTYMLTKRVLWEADRDRLVFTNYAVSHPNVYMFTPDQLMDLPPGLVVIDEAHLWFPARMALKLPMSWLAGMSQTRKKGWDLLFSTQHERRVDRAVIDVAHWLHLTNAWFSHDGHPLLFTQKTWEPEAFRREKDLRGRQFAWFSKRVANAYDTHESVTQADHTHQANDAYAKTGAPAARPASRRRNASPLEGVM